MPSMNVDRVTALPGTLSANTIYLVSGAAGKMEIYSTGNTAAARRVPTESDVQALIDTTFGNFEVLEYATDITERDAFGGIDTSGTNQTQNVSPGTAFVKAVFLHAYTNRASDYSVFAAIGDDCVFRWSGFNILPDPNLAIVKESNGTCTVHRSKINPATSSVDVGPAIRERTEV